MGHSDACDGRDIFFRRVSLREGLRIAVQEGGDEVIEPVLLIFAIVLLMAYLIFALLRPEKF